MAVVNVKIGPRMYKFSCADGQEEHMKLLAESLNQRAEQLTKTIGFMQEGQLLAMLCLLLAEEKNKLAKETNAVVLEETESKMAESLSNLALKIENLTDQLDA